MAMAQQMMNQPGGIIGAGDARHRGAAPAPAAGARRELLTPAQVAQMLGVARSPT